MRNFSDFTKRLNRHCVGTAIGAGFLGLATFAYATPITQLGPGGSTIISGDKLFGNFTCAINQGGGVVGVFTCDNIDVSAHTSVNPPDPTSGDFGIRINGSFNAGTTSEDVVITYDAVILPGNNRLFHDASMWFNGNATTAVQETISDLNAPFGVIGSLTVGNGPGSPTADIVLTRNTTAIQVTKDIGLNFVAPGPTTISIIDQQFSQVPEPGSLALLASALVGAGWFGRRRSNRS